ncbi:hypothetical protein ACIBG8_03620 [Nonomuraea sp. NPDC050556]|uniref:hypothetical protein n=1 Tax=Nonomuraea sp. NPDC050556 TaxID=3364369 RepID=UPI003796CABB
MSRYQSTYLLATTSVPLGGLACGPPYPSPPVLISGSAGAVAGPMPALPCRT